jgi:NAD(P)-dependent dehydrogenase (short-subunit alcohol dehydrogenase family)
MKILITGTSRGLGLELARRYAERGDQVFAATRTGALADGLRATPIVLDVSSTLSIEAAVAAVGAQTDALDLLINNAGVYSGAGERKAEKLGELKVTDAHKVLVVNTVGPILVAQAFREMLLRGSNPKLVSITSGLGSMARNTGGVPYHYGASKAALNHYMRTFAADPLTRGITTLLLHPGWARTDMGGPNATLSAEESVAGMMRVIEGAGAELHGQFVDYAGVTVPW